MKSMTLAPTAPTAPTAPSARRMDVRWAGWSGVAVPVTFLVGWGLAPNPPSTTADAATVAHFFTDHGEAVLHQTFVAGVVVSIFLLVFIAGLWNFLRLGEAEPGVSSLVLLAGAGILPGFVVLSATHAGLAVTAGASDSTVWAIWRVSTFADLLCSLFIGVMIGAASISGAQSRLLPRWLVGLGGVTAIGQLLMQLDALQTGPFLSQDSAFGGLALLLFMVWTAAMGVTMIRSSRGTAATG